MDLWMMGTVEVRVVILLVWRKKSGDTVKGEVEVYTRGHGQPVMTQSAVCNLPTVSSAVWLRGIYMLMGWPHQVIFPADSNSPYITITRLDLFGRHLDPNSNPDHVFQMSLDDLRRSASDALGFMGLLPA